MAQKIKLKNSSTPSKVPLVTDLEVGEVAINSNDARVYIKKDVLGVESIVDITTIQPDVQLALNTKIEENDTRTLTNKTLNDVSNSIHANATHLKIKAMINLSKGQPVKFSGYNQGEDAIEVTAANQATDISIGIVENNISIGEFGTIIMNGILEGIDTSSYTNGSILYVDGLGALTSTEPSSGYSQPIAFVLRSQVNNGAIMINASYPKQPALDVRNVPSGGISAITVQAAINELDTEKVSKNSDITTGTSTKITYDAKGLITSGRSLIASDIPSLDASKITSGTIDSARLPAYVDDVLEFANLAGFPATGETGKIYVALDTNKAYRWSGSVYVYITSGAVDSVAGKTGIVTLVKADVGLESVDNTTDLLKPISTLAQAALDLKAPLSNPTFTGIPTAPTAAVGTDTTQVATTSFVKAEIATLGTPCTIDDALAMSIALG